MKNIECLNGWIRDLCCGDTREKFTHGVRITDGQNVLIIEYPFHVSLKPQKFILTMPNGEEHHYNIGQFNQTRSEIKELFTRCVFGEIGNELVRKSIYYVVDNGNADTFECPLDVGEEHLGIDYYDVYVNTTHCKEGTNELEFILVDGDVFFTVAIEDNTPDEDASIVTIYYWVKI